MSRASSWLSLLVLAGCFPEVPMEYGKDGTVGTDTGALTDSGDPDDPSDPDEDGDGVPASEDCDDTNADISPLADEVCDGIDNNCDGRVDPDDATDAIEWFTDADADGFGTDPSGRACTPPSGSTSSGGDCNDSDAAIHPDALEVCDGTDNDCDGLLDDDDDSLDRETGTTFYADTDDDGFGNPEDATFACNLPSGHVTDATDCNDLEATVNPDAPEVCDDLDNDCDGLVDAADDSVDPSTYRTVYEDTDADGYGDPSAERSACSTPVGAVSNSDDCNDADPTIHPGATEVCDDANVDEDCDGLSDDADSSVDLSAASLWYADADTDGYGDSADAGTLSCDDPSTSSSTYSATADDCDDTAANVNPGATEVCDAADTDEDCDGLADDDDASTDASTKSKWLPDADGDTYGDSSATAIVVCDDPSTSVATYVSDADDCDDTNAAIHPGATEICDAADTDEDCDGLADDADPSLDTSTATDWYVDADGDGFGDDSAAATPFCDAPSTGYGTAADDCDDTDSAVNPDATEICNDVDDDCDATTGQAGLARFVDTSGTETDLATTLGAGTASTPVSWSASAEGTLWICENTWYVNLSTAWYGLDIVGPDGTALTVLDGASAGSVVDASWWATVSLTGLTVQNGGASYGGGLYANTAYITAEDVHFATNIALEDGGAIYVEDASLDLTNCTFDANEAAARGGAIAINGDDGWSGISIDDCTITDSYAADHGGGIYITGNADVSLTGTELSDNLTERDGGGLYQASGALTLDTCTLDLNLANDDGGGAYIKDNFSAEDTTFDSNLALDDGGGIFFDLDRYEDAVLEGTISGTASTTSVSGNSAGDRGNGMVVRIDDDRSSGTLDVDTVDFGTDDVYHETDNSGSISPGDGASFYCDYAGDCR